MKIENLFHIVLFSFLFSTACKPKTSSVASPKEIIISLSADSSAVELRHLQADVLEFFRFDSLGQKEWQSFFAVYPDAPNPELRDLQPALDGKYLVKDSLILFVPQKEFKKDSVYFARCYTRNLLAKPSDMMKGQKLTGKTEVVEFGFKR